MKKLLLLYLCFFLLTQSHQIKAQNKPNPYKIFKTQNLKENPFSATDIHNKNLQQNFDVQFYGLNLNVSSKSTSLTGNLTILAKVRNSQLDTITLELIQELRVDSLFIDKSACKTAIHRDQWLLIPLTKSIPKDSLFNLKIFYHGTPPTEGFFSGVSHAYNSTWKKDVTWTLSEPFAAKEWFPVKQDLTDKADSAWVFLTTDNNEMAGSEGLLTRVVDLPGGKKRYEWKTKYPIDYYLLSFAVSDYQVYQNFSKPKQLQGDSILVQNFVYNSPYYLTYNQTDIDQTPKLIELYSDLFGLYPFWKEKYGHCLTELGGGMEHQTMTTIGSFGFDLVAHELGHMWFGDNITCATWQDIWINEGFATYANYLANEFLKGPEAAQQFITKAQTHAMSQPGGSIYIPSEEIYPGNEWRIFNGRLSYDKGAAVLHMLRHEINDDSLFFNVLKTYQQRFGGKVATGEDFKRVADSVTKKDFSNFFTQWYYGEGYPIYDIKWHQSDDSLYLESIQHTSTQSTRLFRMQLDFGIEYEDGSDTLIRLFQNDTMNHFSIPIHQHVSAIAVDPNHWTLQKVNSLIIDAVPSTKKLYHFTTYPNPVINKLQLRFDNQSQTQKKISIFASDGRLIYTTFSKNKVVNLDFSSYPHGIYIIAAGDKGQNMVQKIVH